MSRVMLDFPLGKFAPNHHCQSQGFSTRFALVALREWEILFIVLVDHSLIPHEAPVSCRRVSATELGCPTCPYRCA